MSATRKTKPDTSGPREADFYPTPRWAVEAVAELMLDSRPKDMPVVYEPGAGDGAILRTLHAYGPDVSYFRGCEIRDEAAILPTTDHETWRCASPGAPTVLVEGTPVPARVEVDGVTLDCRLVPLGR